MDDRGLDARTVVTADRRERNSHRHVRNKRRAALVANALGLVLSDPNVKGVLFNIFGGITRGDEVAKGIVEGSKQVDIKVPLVIRLSGTNEAEGRAILKENGYEVAATMEEAAKKIVALTK